MTTTNSTVSTAAFLKTPLLYLNDAAAGQRAVFVGGGVGRAVLISEARFRELEKAAESAARKEAYYKEMEFGLAQVRAGYGIVKTLDELKAMEDED